MKKPQVINVIEIINGVSNPPKSFVITDEKETDKVVEQAEKLFVKLAIENGMPKEDSEAALEDGNFDDGNGYEVILNWSEVQ